MSDCNGFWLFGDSSKAGNGGRSAVRMSSIDLSSPVGGSKFPYGYALHPQEVLDWIHDGKITERTGKK